MAPTSDLGGDERPSIMRLDRLGTMTANRLLVLFARVESLASEPLAVEAAMGAYLGWGRGWNECDGRPLRYENYELKINPPTTMFYVRALLLGTLPEPDPADELVTSYASSLNMTSDEYETLMGVVVQTASARYAQVRGPKTE